MIHLHTKVKPTGDRSGVSQEYFDNEWFGLCQTKWETLMFSEQLVNTIASANIEMRVLSGMGANLLRKTRQRSVCLK